MASSSSPAITQHPTSTSTSTAAARPKPHKFWLWDDTDNKFPPHRMLVLFAGFILYAVDVGLDVWVAVEYYIADRAGTDPYARYYLAATLFFIIVPCLIINFVSWALYAWGWLIYRNRRLKNFCCERLEQIKYICRRDGGGCVRLEDVDSVVVVDGVRVINWSGDRKRRISRHTGGHGRSGMYEVEAMDLDVLSARPPSDHGKRKDSTAPILSSAGMEEAEDTTDTGLEFYPLDLFDSCEFVAVTLVHALLLGYLFRVLRLLYTRGRDKYSFDRYRDISFLRLIESFLESAPQVVLQLYLLVVHQEAVLWYRIVTPISIAFSIVSLALAVGDYISADKDVDHYDPHPHAEKRQRLSWAGYFTIIFWHLFMIVARGLAFSLFATLYGAYVFLIVGVHYLAMVYWTYWQQARVFKRRPEDLEDRLRCGPEQASWKKWVVFPCQWSLCANFGIEFVVAAFNVFFHFKIRDGRAIVTLIPFYLLSFLENSIMILLWYFGRDLSVDLWYHIPAIVTVFGGFAAGIVLMTCYYLCCQPSGKPSLEPDRSLTHPTMTSTLNRMYEMKQKRGNFFKRIFSCRA